jgi:hypothetical protein
MIRHEETDSWVQRACSDLIVMLLVHSIRVGLFFEEELGNYFEVTMKWHGNPGELSTRPGFRSMELCQLYLEFMALWWESARMDPQSRFPKTFQYIMENYEGDEEQSTKIKQIREGINAGHAELGKMARHILSAPHIFTLVSDTKRGPCLARALVELLHGEGISPIAEYQSRPLLGLSKAFFDLLLNDKKNVVHWYKQLGFAQDTLKSRLHYEFTRLLAEVDDGSAREYGQLNFKAMYPVLFSGLYAVFGLLPSTTRIGEQGHGALRESLKDGVSFRSTDSRQSYMMEAEYAFREQRRKIARQRKIEIAKEKN